MWLSYLNIMKKICLEADTPFKVLKSLKSKPFHRFFVVTEWMDEWDSATSNLSKEIHEGRY